MSENYKRSARYENELVDLFREYGWVSFRVAGSGMKKGPSCDVIAYKEGFVYFIEVKSYDPRLGVKDIRDSSDVLMDIREKAFTNPSNFDAFRGGREGECIFALRERGSSSWKYAPPSLKKINPNRDHDSLKKILVK